MNKSIEHLKILELFQNLSKSVLPIVYIDNNERFSVIGTLIIIEYDNFLYLATASHVLDSSLNLPIYTIINGKLIELVKYVFITKTNNEGKNYDFAFFETIYQSEDLRNNLSKYCSSIDLIDLYNEEKYTKTNICIMYGFSGGRSRAKTAKRFIDFKSKPLEHISTFIDDNEIYNEFKKDTDIFSISKYVQKYKSGKMLSYRPSAKGCSGGSVFRVFKNKENDNDLAVLEGIMLDWKNIKIKEKEYIISLKRERMIFYLTESTSEDIEIYC